MPPTACVDVGELPLQLLLRRQPGWKRQPAAVVSEDKPLGTVVAMNRRARAAGVRAGMRYAAALSLVSHLHAGTISPDELAAGVRQIRTRLLTVSPRVEWGGAGWADPGVFWMEVAGLHRHYPSAAALAETIGQCLRAIGLVAAVVVGSYPPGHLSHGSGGDCAGQPTAAGGAGCGRRARCHGPRAARPAAPGAGGARPAGEAGRGHRGALPAPPLRRVAAPLRHCRGRAAPYRRCVPGPARAGWRPGAGAAAAPPADLPRERCRAVAASLRGAPRPAARPPAGRAGGDRAAVATPAGKTAPGGAN